jgi:hypothetical protein
LWWFKRNFKNKGEEIIMEINAISNSGWGYVVVSALAIYVLTYVKSSNKSAGAQYGFSLVPMICCLLAGVSAMLAAGALLCFSSLGAFMHICILIYAFRKFGHYLA